MPSHESDVMPLDAIRRMPRTMRHAFNACVVVGGLFGGGVSIGYFLGVQQTREDGLAEIARLQQAYGRRIDSAASAVASAAESVGEAANSAASAANAATKAVQAATPPKPVTPAAPARREHEGK